MENELSFLVGKTIAGVQRLGLTEYSDEPCMILHFSDGTSAVLWASYGGYDGKAEDEYPSYISAGPGPLMRNGMKVLEAAGTVPNARGEQ